MRHSLFAIALLLPLSAAAQSPRDIVARGLQAIGGEAAARTTGALVIDQYLATFGIGQSEQPGSPARATITTGRQVLDWQNWRRSWAIETRGVTGAVNPQRLVALADRGAAGGTALTIPLTPAVVAAHQRFLRTNVHRLLLTGMEPGAAIAPAPAREFRGVMHDAVRFTGPDTITVYFDRSSGLPTVLETITDDPILGDRRTTTMLTRWQRAGEILFPRQYDVYANGELQQHIIYAAVTPAAAADSFFAIPDSVANRPQPQPAPPVTTVRMVDIAPGVWRAEGVGHFTLVVEQPDQIVLVEAPLSTQRMRAVIDTVRGRFPNKRIGLAVMTHYHWDHSSGIREVVAEGIPLATHAVNAAFVRQVAAARRTLAPDLQSQRRRAPTLRTFTDSLVIGSGETRVVLYATPTTHAEGLISAWLPSAGVLFTSDVLSPGATLAPAGSAELVALARARGIAPRSFVGGHGTVAPWADVERAAGR